MKQAYQLLIFDWDGTLMDSTAHIVESAQKAMEDCGLTPFSADKIRQLIGLSRHDILETCFPGMDERKIYELECRYDNYFFRNAHKREVKPFEGAVETLNQLEQAGYLMAVATGKSRRGLDEDLKNFDLAKYFVVTRCGDEGFGKPHPEMLESILNMAGVNADMALMIGDSEYDLAMANSVPVDSLAVSYGVQSRQDLLQLNPKGCLDSILELPSWLKNQSK